MVPSDETAALAQQQLARWGLPQEAAETAGIFPVDDAASLEAGFAALPALVIPYFGLDGAPLLARDARPFYRVRYLKEPPIKLSFAKPEKPQRYTQRRGSGVRAYFPPGCDYARGAVVTEGEAKALVATLAGFPTIGLGGVQNFTDKVTGGLLPEVQAIGWQHKTVTICFDSDAVTNPQVQAAEAALAKEFLARGAIVKLARLPGRPDGGKVGIDDYLLSDGAAALRARLDEAQHVGRLEAAILGLNEHVAWVEFEAAVRDLRAGSWIKKTAFVEGSIYSSLKLPGPVRRNGRPSTNGSNDISIARAWLTSPFARRYEKALFAPGAGLTIPDDTGREALNLWTGWRESEGDVRPFLELTEYLFSAALQHRGLPVKWLAYKAQNPAKKIPLALVIVGNEGTGKTLWCKIVREAFSPYGVELASDQLKSPFQGWLETSLVCIINEARGDDVTFGSDNLKTLISDDMRPMNEKYRPVRQVRSYSSYILTSNRREVAAFPPDNRRMFCVLTPDLPRAPEWYHEIARWLDGGGARHVMHYLLTLDLGGWEPPARAPATQEKQAAYTESLNPIQTFAYDALHNTDGTNIVRRMLEVSHAWAQSMAGIPGHSAYAAAELLRAWGTLQLRPWYTAAEIALMFPQIAVTLYGDRRIVATPAGEISRQLRNAGIPYLKNAHDPRGFMLRGRREQYLVVAEFDRWRDAITQQEFEKLIRSFPRYNDLRNKGEG